MKDQNKLVEINAVPLGDSAVLHEMYRLMAPPPGEAPTNCPLCGSPAAVWEYSETLDSEVQRVVMCDHDGPIGPQDGLFNVGCLLYMPPNQFYHGTGRDAVRYWNEFAVALTELRNSKQCVPVLAKGQSK